LRIPRKFPIMEGMAETEELLEPAGGYQVKLKDFDGPLDLLLTLIHENKVNIYDIPIAVITEQYLSYLQFADDVDIDTMSDFHLMAATLLLIKSRMLLPVEARPEGEDEDPRQELVERLIEYQKFRKLSDLMEEREREAEWVMERRKTQRMLPFADEEIWKEADVWALLKVFSRLMNGLPGERVIDLYEEVTINEKITLINELLDRRGEFSFTDLVRAGSMLDVICAFLAVLEAVKVKMVSIFQNQLFGDISIRRSLVREASGKTGNTEALMFEKTEENGVV